MSGSGGGSGFIPGGASTNCQSLVINTQLASPQPAVIAQLNVGDQLTVVLIPPAGPVQLITTGGEIAGAVLTPDVAQLIQCMNDGHTYHAKILGINGANCQIIITHT